MSAEGSPSLSAAPLPSLRGKAKCCSSSNIQVLDSSSPSTSSEASPPAQDRRQILLQQNPNHSPDSPPAPTSSPHSHSQEKMTTLAQMFPLLSRSQIQSVLLQCGGDITATVDQLLVGDLVDRENNMQDQATSYRTLCNLWVKGKCRGGRASACKDRHFYTDG